MPPTVPAAPLLFTIVVQRGPHGALGHTHPQHGDAHQPHRSRPGYGGNDRDESAGISDLSITKTDGQTLTVPGAVVTYTLVVRNAGPSAVTGARVTDPVPATLLGVDVDLHGLARVALSGLRRRSD